MGGASVMRYFALDLTATNRGYQVIRMAHFAHRKGHAYENAECERVRVLLGQAS